MQIIHMKPLVAAAAAAVLALAAIATTAQAAPAKVAPASVGELALRSQVAVDGATIRLADLFDGVTPDSKLAETVVAYSPQPGRRAVFDAEWLNRLAYRLHLPWHPTSRLDRTIVERTSTVVSGTQIVDALTKALKHHGMEGSFDVALSNRNLMLHIDSHLPATVEVASIATDARSERFTAVVAVPANDPQAQRFQVTGLIFPTVEIPVPNHAIRPGDTVRQRDLEWQHVRAAEIRTNMITDGSRIIGKEARRPLRVGAPIRVSDLREPVTVAKGSTVTMIYRTSVMLLTATARAMESGSRGDTIRVMNTQTKKSIDARILGPDKVEVVAGEQLAYGYGDAK